MAGDNEVNRNGSTRSMVTSNSSFLVNSNGLRLHCKTWEPTNTPRGLVFIAHGFAETIDYYERLAQELVRNDYFVFAHDHIGHGKSEGSRVHIDSVDDYVRDVFLHVDSVRKKHGPNPPPIFMAGHSMGGTITIRSAMTRPDFFTGIILIAPGLIPNEQATPWRVFAARLICKVMPQLIVGSLKKNEITRDQQKLDVILADPLVWHGGCKAKWVVAMLNAFDEIKENMHTIEWAVLIQHGDHDTICLLEGSKNFIDSIQSKDKTLKLYKGAFHNLVNELDEVEHAFTADMVDWLNERTKPVEKDAENDNAKVEGGENEV